MDSTKQEILHDIFPYLKVYKDGTLERIAGTETVEAQYDPITGVTSKDGLIIPETGVSARFYKPNLPPNSTKKLPLLIYFHGGAFCIASSSHTKYHEALNKMVAEASVIAMSVDYRLAPEFPLPIAYEDSWDAIKWVASFSGHGIQDHGIHDHGIQDHGIHDHGIQDHGIQDNGIQDHGIQDHEIWIKDHVDFGKVYLAGDSAGANIAHHLSFRVKDFDNPNREFKIHGIVSNHPYFWGSEPIGVEITDSFRKGLVDKWWEFVCPSDEGNDDKLINPFTKESPNLANLGCDRILVCVAEKDILRDRGRLYYEEIMKSGWKGRAEIVETAGEDHVFYIFDPNSESAKCFFKSIATFINQD